MKKTIHSDKQKMLCEMLHQARVDKGLTQAEVAQKLGVPQSWVAKVEIGERRLDVIEFVNLASVIGISPIKVFRALK